MKRLYFNSQLVFTISSTKQLTIDFQLLIDRSRYFVEGISASLFQDVKMMFLKYFKKKKIIRKLRKLNYEIPVWCRMNLEAHADGMGGCWGISGGFIKEMGEKYCKGCEYYRREDKK